MNAARAALLLWTASTILASCSLFVTTDDLAGDAPSADGGAGAEASVAEGGGAPDDGASPVRDDAGAEGGPSPCATSPGEIPFCDDFERSDVVGAWDRATTGDGGVLVIGQDPGGNRFLRVTASGGAGAQLTRESARVFRSAEIAFDVRFRAPPSGATALALVGTRAPLQRFGAIYALIGSSRYLVHHAFLTDDPGTTAGYGQSTLRFAADVGRWQRWDLRLRFEPAPPTAELRIDGLVAAAGEMNASFTATTLGFSVGARFADALDVDIDNVRFDGN